MVGAYIVLEFVLSRKELANHNGVSLLGGQLDLGSGRYLSIGVPSGYSMGEVLIC